MPQFCFMGATSRLVQLLEDGSPLISASWYAADAIRERLSGSPSVDEVVSLLSQKGVGLSIGVVSWGKSPEAASLRDALAEQLTAGKRLTGNLNAVSEAGDLLQSMAQDMNMTFIRLLDEPQLMSMFLRDAGHITEVGPFLGELATNLHGNTGIYFTMRYSEAIKLLNEVISLMTAAVVELGAEELISIARAKSPLYKDATRTAAMLSALAGFEKYLPADIIVKEAAAEKLHESDHQSQANFQSKDSGKPDHAGSNSMLARLTSRALRRAR
jgi:hypothetical protein